VFGAEQRLQLDTWRAFQQVNGGIAVAVFARMVGNQADAQAL
jgi:hypothetical protein